MAELSNLASLATLIRRHILVSTTAAQSGHPTSSLSAVELMTALYFGGILKFDLDHPRSAFNDRVIFSKGHASPLLYALYAAAGALDYHELDSLRTFDSPLEGHPSMRFPFTEAPTGSLGQGLSIGAGMALAVKNAHLNNRIYVLLGDSEMAEGQVWEAVQLASHYRLNNLIGILDINRLGQRGATMLGHDLSTYDKRLQAFGWQTYLVDGHDLSAILQAYQFALSASQPLMIIAKTTKGKGVAAWENLDNFHSKQLNQDQLTKHLEQLGTIELSLQGDIQASTKSDSVELKPATISPAQLSQLMNSHQPWHELLTTYLQTPEPLATKKAVGDAVVLLGQINSSVVVLDAEVSNSTHTDLFQKAFPARFFEMFIAEQNMVSMAVGMSRMGKLPVVSSFAAFLSRAYDQVRMAQYAHTPLIVLGSYAGVSLGKDGFSQMGLEDIGFFRSLSNSIILYPSDAVSAAHVTLLAATHDGISYLRTTREATPILYSDTDHFRIGGSKILRQSEVDQVTIIAAGITVHEALKAQAELMKRNIHARVIDLYSIKPIDVGTVHQAARETKAIITVEDHAVAGGLGEAVRTALADYMIPIHSLAVTKEPRSGQPQELLAFENIDAAAIVRTVQKVVE